MVAVRNVTVKRLRETIKRHRKNSVKTPTDEHSRANVLHVAFDCLLWSHRILVVGQSLFVRRIERVLYFLLQCVEPPVDLILGGGG